MCSSTRTTIARLPWTRCHMGIEICRDGMRDYRTVRWKAHAASTAIEKWAPKWFHYIDDELPEEYPHLALISLGLALAISRIRY